MQVHNDRPTRKADMTWYLKHFGKFKLFKYVNSTYKTLAEKTSQKINKIK